MSSELNELIAKAQAGSAEAKYDLAVKYRNGYKLRKNPAAAFKLFAEAAQSHHAHSCCVLGQMYEGGEGTDSDDARAAQFYRRAAESDHASGKFGLSRMYEFGRGGLPLDLGEAVRLCGEAAKTGHGAALRKLSAFAENGMFSAALRLARLKLAAMYETGNGVPQDDGEALKLFRAAAETQSECLPAFLRGKLLDLGRAEHRELLLNDCRQSLGRLSPEREAALAAFAGMLNALSAEELNGFARCALPLGPADRTRGWRSTLQKTGENRRDALKNPVTHVVRRAPLAFAALELQRLARIASAIGDAKLAREARNAAKERLASLLDALAWQPTASGESEAAAASCLLKAA